MVSAGESNTSKPKDVLKKLNADIIQHLEQEPKESLEMLGAGEHSSQELLESASSKIQNQTITVADYALCKAGKTTLMNSFAQGNVLPFSNDPTTSGITALCHSEMQDPQNLELYKFEGEFSNLTELMKGQADAICEKIGVIQNQLRLKAQGEFSGSCPEKLLLKIHIPVLSKFFGKDGCNILLLDTPGRNEAANEMVRVFTNEIMQKADVMLLVFNYTYLKSKDERDMFLDLATRPELFSTDIDRIFFIVNKFDCEMYGGMGEADTIQYVHDLIYRYTSIKPKRENIMVTSAKRALDARLLLSGKLTPKSKYFEGVMTSIFGMLFDKEDFQEEELKSKKNIDIFNKCLKQSKFEQVEDKIFSFIANNVQPLKLDSIKGDLVRFCKSILERANSAKKQLANDLETSKNSIETLKKIEKDVEGFMKSAYEPFQKEFCKAAGELLKNTQIKLENSMRLVISNCGDGETKVLLKGKTEEECREEALAKSKEIASKVKDSLIMGVFQVMVQLEMEIRALAAEFENKFQKKLVIPLNEYLKQLEQKYTGGTGLISQIEGESCDLPSVFAREVREAIMKQIDWDEVQNLVRRSLEKSSETIQQPQTSQISVPYETTVMKNMGEYERKRVFLFFTTKVPKLTPVTETKYISVPTIKLVDVQQDYYHISTKKIAELAGNVAIQGLGAGYEAMEESMKQLIEKLCTFAWKDVLSRPIQVALRSSEETLKIRQSASFQQEKSVQDLDKNIIFFTQILESLNKLQIFNNPPKNNQN